VCGLLKPLIGLSERALQACFRLPMSIRFRQLITLMGKGTLSAWVRQDGL
jgi:hypothetical protein